MNRSGATKYKSQAWLILAVAITMLWGCSTPETRETSSVQSPAAMPEPVERDVPQTGSVGWSALLKQSLKGPIEIIDQPVLILPSMLKSEFGFASTVESPCAGRRFSMRQIDPTLEELLYLLESHGVLYHQLMEVDGRPFIRFLCSPPDRNSARVQTVDTRFRPIDNHSILQRRIDGPVKSVQQDVGLLLTALSRAINTPITTPRPINRSVTLSMMNPTVKELLDSLSALARLRYEVGESPLGLEIRVWPMD